MEDEPTSAGDLVKGLFRHSGAARVIGVTGPPGAGKSTLIEGLARRYLARDQKVGILAVDPTSPFSGGAVLGDRIRMQSLAVDSRVFIRSMATRGRLGGLATSVRDALTLVDAAGYGRILLETVGVGQDEVDVFGVAQITVVVLVPGMGDAIQAIKAGVMEIADVFVVNKSDHPGAERLISYLRGLSRSGGLPGRCPRIVSTVATEGEGLDELAEEVERVFASADGAIVRQKQMMAEKSRVLELVRERILRDLFSRYPESSLDRQIAQIVDRRLDPYTVVESLVAVGLESTAGTDSGDSP